MRCCYSKLYKQKGVRRMVLEVKLVNGERLTVEENDGNKVTLIRENKKATCVRSTDDLAQQKYKQISLFD